MKPTTILLAAAFAVTPLLAASAGEAMYHAPNDAYFDNLDRATPYAHGYGSIQGRYPVPLAATSALNIPAGAGAPVPVDPFALPRPYALGEAYVAAPRRVIDAKGNAAHDTPGLTAWDGQGRRMSFN